MNAVETLMQNEIDRLAADNAALARWRSTNAPRLAVLQGLLDAAQIDAAKGAEAIASLASERAANALLTGECEALQANLATAMSQFALEEKDNDALRSELELRRKSGDPSSRLHNLCEAISDHADGSEWSREEWTRIDKENTALTARVKALEDALRGVAGSHAWHSFGECHSFGDGPLLTPREAYAAARAALEMKP